MQKVSMYSGPNARVQQSGVNLLIETNRESSPHFGLANASIEPSDSLRIDEVVTVFPAGNMFPIPLRLHIRIGCHTPESVCAESVQASLHDLLTEVTDAIRNSLDDRRHRENGKSAENSPKVIHFGDVQVDVRKMELYRAGRRIVLTTHEFKTLRYFLEHPNAVISREELLSHVWGYHHYPTTRTVDNRILRLRRKLEPNPSQPIYFLTVHGTGYKFVP
ncbi:MAG TPA: response regulator transcription factor [Terriglobales bacterium]|nr:response regulator transcription factor [Terriglobales bacterium]